jgi:hypothetical protein
MSTTEYSTELAELAKALAAAQAEFTAIPKDSANPFFQSKYAGLPKVVEVASPVLSKHGLSVSQFIGHDDQGDTLTTWLLHQSGQFIRDTMRLRPVKNDPQSQGSATTYARRYSYMSVLGLVADDDDDGNQASQGSTQRSGGKSKASPSARQSRSSTPRTADPETGEIPEPPNVQAAIDKLDQDGRKQLQEKMTAANFPPVEKLPTAAARQVVKWAEEIRKAQEAGEPF